MASTQVRSIKRSSFWGVYIACSLLGILGLFWSVGSLIEGRTWDARIRAVGIQPLLETPVRIINIDQASLDYLATHEHIYWPWPRGIYEALLEFLDKAGAKAVAFDILFLEPSTVSEDRAFAHALKSHLPVSIAVALRRSKTLESEEDRKTFSDRYAQLKIEERISEKFLPKPDRALLTEYPDITLPIPELLTQAAIIGNVEGVPDNDGIFRHHHPISLIGDRPVPSLPLSLFMLAYPERGMPFKDFFDDSGKLAVRLYGKKATLPTYSFANVMVSLQNIMADAPPLIPLETFKDAAVFVGMDAPGLLDLRPTSLSPNFPGVEYNATVFQNIYEGQFAVKMPFIPACGLVLALVLLGAGSIFFVSSFREKFLWIAVSFAGWSLALILTTSFSIWIPCVIPTLSFLAAVLLSLFIEYTLEGRQHRFIRNAFRYYVSPSVIEKIVSDPNKLALGGEKRELSIFFSDIAGFTTISESIEPTKLVPLLNLYLTSMTNAVLETEGTVDKYVGDAVVAFWNAPVVVEDHARKAVLAALTCQRRLAGLQKQFKSEFGVEVNARIGINTGTVAVGNFGSSARFNYTVIGDAANLASRLEGANKYFGTKIMIAERTHELLGSSLPCRKIAILKVIGKNRGVSVYEPLDTGHPLLGPGILDSYHQAISLFESGKLEEADEVFANLPPDKVISLYRKRIIDAKTHGFGTEWNPIWSMTEK